MIDDASAAIANARERIADCPELWSFIERRALEEAVAAKRRFSMRAIMEEVLDGLMFDSPSDPTITRVVVTRQGVEDKKSFDYEHDPMKKPVRMMIPVPQQKGKPSRGRKTFA